MTKNIKISALFLLTSIVTIFIDKISILGPLKISDCLLVVSFLFFLFSIFKKEINILEEKKIINFSLISIGLILLGTISSLIIFKNIPVVNTLKGYGHILSDFIILLEIIVISKYNRTFPKKILFSFLFSLLITPFIYISSVSKYILYGDNRFEGLLNDPNYFLNFQIIPTLLILFFILRDNQKKLPRVFLYVVFCFSIGLILWSGSRSGLLGLVASFALLVILLIPKISKKKWVSVIFLILLSFPIGFYLIPKKSQNDIKLRISSIQTTKKTTSDTQTPINNIRTLTNNIQTPKTMAVISKPLIFNFTSDQDRLNIWKNSLYSIMKNPLGYGPGYNMITNIRGDGEEHRVAHNFELELLLTGGVLLFVLINFALYKIIIKSIKNCYTYKFNEIHILLSILAGLLVSGIFLDSFLASRWIWIIVALLIAHNRQLSSTEELQA